MIALRKGCNGYLSTGWYIGINLKVEDGRYNLYFNEYDMKDCAKDVFLKDQNEVNEYCRQISDILDYNTIQLQAE